MQMAADDRLLFGSPSGFLVAVCRSESSRAALRRPPSFRTLWIERWLAMASNRSRSSSKWMDGVVGRFDNVEDNRLEDN